MKAKTHWGFIAPREKKYIKTSKGQYYKNALNGLFLKTI
jgi:hypothetical protein